MGLRNAEQEILRRLESKTLDAQLRQILVAGLNCSPFEADAVIDAAQEVYFPFLEQHGEALSPPMNRPVNPSPIALNATSRSRSIAVPKTIAYWPKKGRSGSAANASPSCANKRFPKALC